MAISARNSSNISTNGAIPLQLHSLQLNCPLAENCTLLCQHWISSTGHLATFPLRQRKNSALLRPKHNLTNMPKSCHLSGWDKKCISRSQCLRNGTLLAQLQIKGITANSSVLFCNGRIKLRNRCFLKPVHAPEPAPAEAQAALNTLPCPLCRSPRFKKTVSFA